MLIVLNSGMPDVREYILGISIPLQIIVLTRSKHVYNEVLEIAFILDSTSVSSCCSIHIGGPIHKILYINEISSKSLGLSSKRLIKRK